MDDETKTIGLKRHKMKVSTVVFMLFCLCSGGCFGIEDMIPAAGPGLTIAMLIILPFVWSLPMGLISAELGSARPEEGGYYKWVQEACGEFWGFQAGWWRTVSTYVNNTLYIILVGGYVTTQYGLNGIQEFLVKVFLILLFMIINLRGIKDVGLVSSIFSMSVLVAFALVAVVGFMHWNTSPVAPFIPEGQSLMSSIGGGLAIGMWCYAGYESMSTVAGEIEDPQVIPKAILIAIPMIAAVYILPTMAGLASLGQWDSWTSDGGVSYSMVLSTYLHPAFGWIFLIIAAIANLSIYNTYIASGSRGFFALADDHLAPPVLAKCDKKNGVPYASVILMGISHLILCNFAFNVVVVIGMFLLMASYMLILISGIILRKKIPDSERPFKIPVGYRFLCLMCVIPVLIIIYAFFTNGSDYFIGGMVGLITGPIAYIFWKRKYGGLNKTDPLKYPVSKKTGLALGDLKRMSDMFIILALIGLAGSFFLPRYEADWGNAYYLETYGINNMLPTFVMLIKCTSAAVFAIGIVLRILNRKEDSETDEASCN